MRLEHTVGRTRMHATLLAESNSTGPAGDSAGAPGLRTEPPGSCPAAQPPPHLRLGCMPAPRHCRTCAAAPRSRPHRRWHSGAPRTSAAARGGQARAAEPACSRRVGSGGRLGLATSYQPAHGHCAPYTQIALQAPLTCSALRRAAPPLAGLLPAGPRLGAVPRLHTAPSSMVECRLLLINAWPAWPGGSARLGTRSARVSKGGSGCVGKRLQSTQDAVPMAAAYQRAALWTV